MNLSLSIMDRIYIVIVFLTILSTGCGIRSNSLNSNHFPVPPSNKYVAETVVQSAFKDIYMPDGNGMKVSYTVDGTDKAYKIADILASEYLHNNGYIVTDKKNTVPELQITVDTLFVAFTDKRIEQNVKQVSRSAEAKISIVWYENNSRKVYNGHGKFQDFVPCSMLEAVGMNESYVVKDNHFLAIFKPVLYGITITSLAWYLYSYRG